MKEITPGVLDADWIPATDEERPRCYQGLIEKCRRLVRREKYPEYWDYRNPRTPEEYVENNLRRRAWNKARRLAAFPRQMFAVLCCSSCGPPRWPFWWAEMGRFDTFGPIDWRAYYRGYKPVTPLEELPCNFCGRMRCNVVPDPAGRHGCRRYLRWARKWWPIVTEPIKRAAHRAGTSEDGKR